MPVPDQATQQYHGLLQAVMARPDGENYYRLGCWLHDSKHWLAGAGAFAKTVYEQPQNHRALTNMGWSLHLSGRCEEALAYLNKAIDIEQGDGTPYALRAQVRMILGDDAGAIEDGARAAELGAEVPLNRLAHAFALLNAGEYRKGWQENEWRFSYTLPEFLTRPYRLWRGEWVETLYVEADQGSGDSIFASRWLPTVFERVEKTIVFCHRELYSLFSLNFHNGETVWIYPLPRPLPCADAFVPMMSIPTALELDDVGHSGDAYLKI